jgi:hypothetical protein
MPSDSKKPSASSASCPGVRIVSASVSPSTRISSGSSTITASSTRSGGSPRRWRTAMTSAN